MATTTTAQTLGTEPPHRPRAALAGAVQERLRELTDRFVGFDPGLTQLLRASHAILALTLAGGLGYLFEQSTGAMRISGSGVPAALVQAQHHGALIIAMLLPAIVAMLDSTGVVDGTVRNRIISSVGSAAIFFGAMALGLVVARHRLPLLIWLVLAPVVAVYIRRFPSRGFVLGVALFNGAFLAYFMHTEIALHDLGWVAAEVSLGMLASVALRLLVFRPDDRLALHRMQRAWVARTHTVVDLTAQLTEQMGPRRRARLNESVQRQLVRLNESSLMIDAQLAQPEAVEGSASLLHQRLFDQELAVSNIARFTEALMRQDLAPTVVAGLHAVLIAMKDGDLDRAVLRARALGTPRESGETAAVLVRRFVQSVLDLADAQREWLTAGQDAAPGAVEFVPAVSLISGYLPGSGAISERAGRLPGRRRFEATSLEPYERSTLQIAVAATIAVTVGDLVDGQRLYWALLATFLAFMATSNSGEQVRKAFYRMLGTAVGIVIGDGLVHLTDGNLAVSMVVIALALFVGFYLVRVNYMFLVVGITITMSQLYVQLHEFSWHLLLLRLAETSVGVAAVVVSVLVVVPLRGSRVLAAAVIEYLDSLQELVALSLSTLSRLPEGYPSRPPTRLDVRRVDVAYQGLLTAATPLRFGLFGHRATRLNDGLAVASAARYYARNLAAGVEYSDLEGTEAFDRATAALLGSISELRTFYETGVGTAYVRSAALFDEAYRQTRGPDQVRGTQLVVRDVMLLDGALARMARAQGLPVTDTDT